MSGYLIVRLLVIQVILNSYLPAKYILPNSSFFRTQGNEYTSLF